MDKIIINGKDFKNAMKKLKPFINFKAKDKDMLAESIAIKQLRGASMVELMTLDGVIESRFVPALSDVENDCIFFLEFKQVETLLKNCKAKSIVELEYNEVNKNNIYNENETRFYCNIKIDNGSYNIRYFDVESGLKRIKSFQVNRLIFDIDKSVFDKSNDMESINFQIINNGSKTKLYLTDCNTTLFFEGDFCLDDTNYNIGLKSRSNTKIDYKDLKKYGLKIFKNDTPKLLNPYKICIGNKIIQTDGSCIDIASIYKDTSKLDEYKFTAESLQDMKRMLGLFSNEIYIKWDFNIDSLVIYESDDDGCEYTLAVDLEVGNWDKRVVLALRKSQMQQLIASNSLKFDVEQYKVSPVVYIDNNPCMSIAIDNYFIDIPATYKTKIEAAESQSKDDVSNAETNAGVYENYDEIECYDDIDDEDIEYYDELECYDDIDYDDYENMEYIEEDNIDTANIYNNNIESNNNIPAENITSADENNKIEVVMENKEGVRKDVFLTSAIENTSNKIKALFNIGSNILHNLIFRKQSTIKSIEFIRGILSKLDINKCINASSKIIIQVAISPP